MTIPQYTPDMVQNMTPEQAELLGVKQFQDGKTFAAANVRPPGFFMACLQANRFDLVTALDHGWHVANLAAPVVREDGTVMDTTDFPSTGELEEITSLSM